MNDDGYQGSGHPSQDPPPQGAPRGSAGDLVSDPRGGEPLPYELRAELQARASRVGPAALAVQLDVTEMVLARALAGFAVKGSSVKLIRAGLERVAKDLPPANPMDGAIDRAKARSMGREVARGVAAGALPKSIDDACDVIDRRLSGAGQMVDREAIARSIRPVCPRCLDIVPGTPGGSPESPHPGPFTAELCAPCSRAYVAECEETAGRLGKVRRDGML